MTKIKIIFLADVMLVLIFFSSCAVNSSQPTISLKPTPTLAQPTYQGKTISVTSTADSGPGTLRQALLDAENGDFINFDDKIFPPTNPTTIYVNSELPLISQGDITIDASNAGVILNGHEAQGERVNGLTIRSDGNTIRGLQIVGFKNNGIALHAGQDNTIGGAAALVRDR